MDEPNIYRTLGELVAEVRELRRLIVSNADHVDRRLTELEEEVSEIARWREQVRGGATAFRWLWLAAGTGIGTTIVGIIASLAQR